MKTKKHYDAGLMILAVTLTALTAESGELKAGGNGDESRPKIGLVLGGGGALGMSHVGVLRVLEEMHIPIDYIGGTSMGSIIGGLYASGKSPDEIQAILEGQDWNELMSDSTPRRELFYRRKLDDQRYLFELGVKKSGLALGPGMAAGQKFNNLLQFETLSVVAITNFDLLPIPFRAVATDLKSGTPYVIDHGSIATAMRSSMAVPGAFTPVSMDGRILVDGGIVDNLPVDVVKAMGADIIIAVDVGAAAEKVDEENLKTLGGILGRTYTIAQRPEQMEQFKAADIGIQPDLTGFTASQFDRAAAIIPHGEAAAHGKSNELSRLSVSGREFNQYLQRQRRSVPKNLTISSIGVSGNQRVSTNIIQRRIHSKANEPFNQKTVEQDLLRVYGIGEFEQILAKLKPVEDGSNELNYTVTEKPWGPLYFKYGLQLQTDLEKDAQWNMLLNLTRMSINSLGAEWRNEVQLGSANGIVSEFYQPLDAGGFLFLAPNIYYQSKLDNVYDGEKKVAEYDIKSFTGKLDFGVQLRQYAEFRIGPMWGTGKASVETGESDLPEVDENYAGVAVSLVVDRQDRTLFAREGYYVDVEGRFAEEGFGSERSYQTVTANIKKQASWGDHTVSVIVQGGSSLGSELPGYALFSLGGPFSFAGLAEGQFRGEYLGVGSLGYRYRLLTLPSAIGRAVYVMTRIDTGNVWTDEVDTGDVRYGSALGLGADSAIGPLYIAYGRTDDGYDSFYFSLGTAF